MCEYVNDVSRSHGGDRPHGRLGETAFWATSPPDAVDQPGLKAHAIKAGGAIMRAPLPGVTLALGNEPCPWQGPACTCHADEEMQKRTAVPGNFWEPVWQQLSAKFRIEMYTM